MTNLYEAGERNKYYLKYDKEEEGGWYFDICNADDVIMATSKEYDTKEEAVGAFIDMADYFKEGR